MDKKWGGVNFTKPDKISKLKYKPQNTFQKSKEFPEPKSSSKTQRFLQSDNVSNSKISTNLVHAKDIIENIKLVDERYKTSNERTKSLLKHINEAQTSINQVVNKKKGHSWGSLDKDALLSLIIDVNRASSRSVSSISDLIKNNNENSKLLAEMISALTVLSGLSFKQISETTAELEDIANHLQQSTNGSNVQGIQIKRIIVSQIEKFKEEKERTEKNETNFDVIFKKLQESEEQLQLQLDGITKSFQLRRDELTQKFKDFETETLGTIKAQKRKIKLLSAVSISNLILIFAFIIYFILR